MPAETCRGVNEGLPGTGREDLHHFMQQDGNMPWRVQASIEESGRALRSVEGTLAFMKKLIFLACAAAAAGCSPVTLSVTLFADSSRLVESQVQRDKHARDAKIVMIDVRGVIAEKAEGGLLGGTGVSVDDLAVRLRKAEEDSSVKAVILRINSPGGTVTGSDIMYREVRRFAAESRKPVVASLGEVAASGGYYLALAADRIIAEPTSVTGSIGVIMPTLNVSEGLNRIGIHSRSIKSGKNKDLANPLEPMRDEHYAVLQATVDEFYERFKGLVIERRTRPAMAGVRSLEMSRVDDLTDGRVVTGERAAAFWLVDQTGGVSEAFAIAKGLAGIDSATLVKYFSEGSARPRTPYAGSAAQQGMEINLVQIRAGMLTGLGYGGVYYLWMGP